MSEELQEVISDWSTYNPGDHQTIKKIIKDNINSVCANYVAIGYYLNNISDRKLYQEDGYSGIGEYAAAEYGIQKDKCSYLMKIAAKFCIPNSPALLPEYREFTVHKLREMLYLTDDQLEQVAITTTVAEIRDIRKPETVKVAISQLEPEVQTPEPACFIRDQINSTGEDDLKCSGGISTDCDSCDKSEPSPLITEDEFIIGFYRHMYDSEKQLVQQRNNEQLRTDLINNHGKGYESTNCILDGWTSCYPDKVVFRQNRCSTQIQLSWGKVVSRIFKLVDEGRIKIEPAANDQPKTVNAEPETVDNQPEIVNDVDESVIETSESVIEEPENEERVRFDFWEHKPVVMECSNCNYDTMSLDEYRVQHPEAEEHPCNDCDDKLCHWAPKVDRPSSKTKQDDDALPCEKRIQKEPEPEQVEIVEADIIKTPSEDTDPEEYSLSDIQAERRLHTDNLAILRKGNTTSAVRYKTKMRLDAITLLAKEMQKPVVAKEPKPVQPELPQEAIEAMQYRTPKKMVNAGDDLYKCPTCEAIQVAEFWSKKIYSQYCPVCGQALEKLNAKTKNPDRM